MQIHVKKAGYTYYVDFESLPEISRAHVIAYGLRQIINDACASAKTPDEARGLCDKRVDGLLSGVLRASPVRAGDPIRARALELASDAILASAKFQGWLVAAGLKKSAKPAVAKVRELAEAQIAIPGNRFTTQAEIDVASAKVVLSEDLDLDL